MHGPQGTHSRGWGDRPAEESGPRQVRGSPEQAAWPGKGLPSSSWGKGTAERFCLRPAACLGEKAREDFQLRTSELGSPQSFEASEDSLSFRMESFYNYTDSKIIFS